MYILQIIRVKPLRKLRYQLDNLPTSVYFQPHNISAQSLKWNQSEYIAWYIFRSSLLFIIQFLIACTWEWPLYVVISGWKRKEQIIFNSTKVFKSAIDTFLVLASFLCKTHKKGFERERKIKQMRQHGHTT